jgi:hypothetical protein
MARAGGSTVAPQAKNKSLRMKGQTLGLPFFYGVTKRAAATCFAVVKDVVLSAVAPFFAHSAAV